MCRIRSWLFLLLLLIITTTNVDIAVCRESPKPEPRAATPKPTSLWAASVSNIPHLTGPEFTLATRFLLQMCSNAYEYQVDTTHPLPPIPGWHLSSKVRPLAPPCPGAAGLRALVYEEDPQPLHPGPTRVVLVFRGWQTSSTSTDELADLCAGKRLFPHYVDFLSPPSHLCSYFFNATDLDYLSQAITHTCLVLTHYKPSSLLLTGHGFGAGLAMLVSAALQNAHHHWCSPHAVSGFSSIIHRDLIDRPRTTKNFCRVTLPTLTFSGPGIDHYLVKQGWKLYRKDYIITISSNWDFFSVRARWRYYRGWLCLYDVCEPLSCEKCFSDELRSSSLEVLKSRTLSFNKTVKGKAKKKEDDDHDDDDDDDDEEDEDEDEDDDDDDDDDDNDHDDSVCPCKYDDQEPCWDCVTDTHSPKSLKAASDTSLTPTCKFYK